ncbi:MAG: NADH-quinone oxidoreductase subunit L, partial [Rariglobus sp.]
FIILAFGAVLTSFYMVRLWRLVFFGAPRTDDASHAHEGGISMTLPLIVLALLSVAGGYTAIYGGAFNGIWSQIPVAHGAAHTTILIVSVVVMVLGAGVALVLYKPAPTDALAAKAPGVFASLTLLKGSFDSVYNWYVSKVQQRFALVLEFLERILLSGLIIRGLAGVVGLVGLGARATHTGSLHTYVYWFLAGAAILWAFAGGWLN